MNAGKIALRHAAGSDRDDRLRNRGILIELVGVDVTAIVGFDAGAIFTLAGDRAIDGNGEIAIAIVIGIDAVIPKAGDCAPRRRHETRVSAQIGGADTIALKVFVIVSTLTGDAPRYIDEKRAIAQVESVDAVLAAEDIAVGAGHDGHHALALYAEDAAGMASGDIAIGADGECAKSLFVAKMP